MALHKRGDYRYGDSQADIRDELLRYSKANEYAAIISRMQSANAERRLFVLLSTTTRERQFGTCCNATPSTQLVIATSSWRKRHLKSVLAHVATKNSRSPSGCRSTRTAKT